MLPLNREAEEPVDLAGLTSAVIWEISSEIFSEISLEADGAAALQTMVL